MNCKYFTRRSKKRENKINAPYCRNPKIDGFITSCVGCKKAEYKDYTPIKKVSKKRAKAERERKSIFTTDLDHCIENKYHTGKIDRHEIFDGKNRLKSMKYGLVIGICRNCHDNEEIQKKWQVIGRQAFIEKHGEDLFIKEFQTKKGLEVKE